MRSIYKVAVVTIFAGFMTGYSSLVAADERAALQERLGQISNMDATFSQQVTDGNGELVQQLHGRLALARPHFLYWQTDAPDETVMVADGTSLWYYNPFVEQVTVTDQTDTMEQSPLLLLLDDSTAAWDDYVVKQEGDSFALQPLAHANSLQSLQLVFEAQSPVMRTIILDDGQGQISTIELADVTVNEELASTLFEFTIPEGVDVDDQRNPQG
ncbi:outer membrane lipoprotein carrier protein LolA [Pseudidiomarina aestuarii]|uniref:Outer-membrane lipoprotein carrier protein n=1 Tax=Pseudidiomarina aestuarii TaxID=624146 RepID=A0A7Z6ZTN1_9GAMM|nr:outer membrane lipoprotein chaperone LolA [Pseudidiomarina aestuarii]RUO41042.1 outer membrane lipoprotein carrier protein LolA [Pseudidiomarina aestuarii]